MNDEHEHDEQPLEPDRDDTGAGVTVAVRVARLRDGERAEADDAVVREQSITLFVGGRRLLRLQCLPKDIEDLALGLLATSDLLPPGAPVPAIRYEPGTHEVHVDLGLSDEAIAALREAMTLGSGCGSAFSPTGDFDPFSCSRRIDTAFRVSPDAISQAMTALMQRSTLFRDTGGVHSAAIAQDDTLVAFADDIGRHNAFDKVVGACRRQAIELIDRIALVTGRLSRELVAKAVPVSLPVLVSRGAPTDAGIALAEQANLTLVGFARAGRMNIYTAEWRIA